MREMTGEADPLDQIESGYQVLQTTAFGTVAQDGERGVRPGRRHLSERRDDVLDTLRRDEPGCGHDPRRVASFAWNGPTPFDEFRRNATVHDPDSLAVHTLGDEVADVDCGVREHQVGPPGELAARSVPGVKVVRPKEHRHDGRGTALHGETTHDGRIVPPKQVDHVVGTELEVVDDGGRPRHEGEALEEMRRTTPGVGEDTTHPTGRCRDSCEGQPDAANDPPEGHGPDTDSFEATLPDEFLMPVVRPPQRVDVDLNAQRTKHADIGGGERLRRCRKVHRHVRDPHGTTP